MGEPATSAPLDTSPLIITLYADASFCQETEAAGLAYWTRTSDGRWIWSGLSRVAAENSTIAEAEAVYRGFRDNIDRMRERAERLKSAGMFGRFEKGPPASMFVIKTDCQAVVNWFRFKPRHKPGSYKVRQMLVDMDQVSEEFAVWRKVRWVKGHGGGDTTESWINERVDAMAREKMQRERERRRRRRS